jgi:acyl-CoA reductase-like NAD-dependent aldehyde dehydrogenase
MNDSPYGLTASIWTNASDNPSSELAFLKFVEGLQTGTVFLNRCDYLDPALAWTGVKNSGRGISLSAFGELQDLHQDQIVFNTDCILSLRI